MHLRHQLLNYDSDVQTDYRDRYNTESMEQINQLTGQEQGNQLNIQADNQPNTQAVSRILVTDMISRSIY